MTRFLLSIVLQMICVLAFSQKAENIIIITTDGLRWQELFNGMDSSIANNKAFNEGDSAHIYQHYWSSDASERRRKLFPFLWTAVQSNGQLYGNRHNGSLVNNANPHWFSYPGYSEILTGHVDTAINTNSYPPNPHVTVLEYLNRQEGYSGKVAAFGAWNAFDRIINQQRSGIPVVCGYDLSGGSNPNAAQQLINRMLQDSYKPWGEEECLDVFTHHAAFEELKKNKPRVLYIAYGETDEWAHAGRYRSYLDAAHQVDAWIKEIWDFVQSDPQYKNKTALFITTDHGRGDKVKEQWTDHGSAVVGANEIWMAAMGPGIAAKGEMKNHETLYQQQFAQTIARLLGKTYTADHVIAAPVKMVLEK